MISSLVAYDDSDSETETGKAEDPHMSSRKTNPASSAVNHLQCFAPGGLDKKFTCKMQPAENTDSSTPSMVHKDCSAYYVQTERELTAAYPSKVYPGHTTGYISYKSCDQVSGSLIKSELLSGNGTSSQKRVYKDDVATISGIRPYIPKRLRQEKSASVSERKESEGQGEKTSDEIKPDRSGQKSSIKISEFVKPYLGSKYKSTEIPKNLVFQIAKHRGPINKVQWCPVQEWSHMLLSASMDNTVKIWDAVDTGRCLKTYSCHSCAVRAAQWSLCGRRILSGGFDFMLHLTDVETGAQVFTSKNESRISTLKFHPSDPNIFICGGFGPEVKAWDIRNCKVIKVYKAAVQQTLDVLFLPEGKEFLTSTDAVSRDSADRTIIAWDFHSAAKISNQIFHERYTCPSLTLHPKESTFVAQTNGNYMALFSTQRPYRINKKKRYEGHKVEGFAVDCEFSPDGALLLTGSSEGKVFFYNYHTARIIHTLSAHDQACVSATFHPVLPSLLATCDWAGEIKVWQ
ncbi:PREDICTED: WD repeat-containing protein 25 [Gavialis gangeticus]|uniref:WD repeat-containing protein 25 n=1 Tax=Gavialis gangeticus TaxID=94835 RepID=UPI00092EF55C|nr:PREDICTED: WD repeat-containing protein 25 [Gavialis gangeticus]